MQGSLVSQVREREVFFKFVQIFAMCDFEISVVATPARSCKGTRTVSLSTFQVWFHLPQLFLPIQKSFPFKFPYPTINIACHPQSIKFSSSKTPLCQRPKDFGMHKYAANGPTFAKYHIPFATAPERGFGNSSVLWIPVLWVALKCYMLPQILRHIWIVHSWVQCTSTLVSALDSFLFWKFYVYFVPDPHVGFDGAGDGKNSTASATSLIGCWSQWPRQVTPRRWTWSRHPTGSRWQWERFRSVINRCWVTGVASEKLFVG